jgi:hypothetical protein
MLNKWRSSQYKCHRYQMDLTWDRTHNLPQIWRNFITGHMWVTLLLLIKVRSSSIKSNPYHFLLFLLLLNPFLFFLVLNHLSAILLKDMSRHGRSEEILLRETCEWPYVPANKKVITKIWKCTNMDAQVFSAINTKQSETAFTINSFDLTQLNFCHKIWVRAQFLYSIIDETIWFSDNCIKIFANKNLFRVKLLDVSLI